MQQEQSSLNKKYQWLETVEGLAVIGSFGGTIASIVLQQAALASVPLSLSVMLNVVNRRLPLNSLNASQESAIAQTIQANNFVTQDQFTSIRNQLAQLQEKGVILSRNQDQLNDAIAQIDQQNNTTQNKIEQMIALASQPTNSQPDAHQMPSEDIQSLLSTQATISKTLQTLKQIEVYNQAIQLNPTAVTYYNRALSYESLAEKQAAIGDYSAAIRLDSNYAEAYSRRGLAYIELGNKKEAIKDLRTAAKLYFAQGDIDKYQQAKDLTKQLHEVSSHQTNTSAGVVETLFAAASS